MIALRRMFGALLLTACGGQQPQVSRPELIETEEHCCLEERWEAPPEAIGATPPPVAAPADALEPFRPER